MKLGAVSGCSVTYFSIIRWPKFEQLLKERTPVDLGVRLCIKYTYTFHNELQHNCCVNIQPVPELRA
jgi:hypothetical protein